MFMFYLKEPNQLHTAIWSCNTLYGITGRGKNVYGFGLFSVVKGLGRGKYLLGWRGMDGFDQ